MRMIIVDEVMTNCIVMKRMAMKVFGGEIDLETSPLAAVHAMRERTYDIIVTGYKMPEMDGSCLVALVRSIDENRRTPVIMTSSCLEPAVRARLAGHGVDAFVAKPINAEQFRQKIFHYLSIRPSVFAA